MSDKSDQTLAVFLVSDNKAAERLLKRVQDIDAADPNVKIIDSAIAEHTKQGRVKIHQDKQVGSGSNAMHGGAIGIVVGAILLGPVGAAAGGAAGAALGGVHNKLHDFGIDDKMMKLVAGEVDNGRSAVFILYEGNWSHSIDLVKQAVQAEGASAVVQHAAGRDTPRRSRRSSSPSPSSLVAKRWSRTTRSTSKRSGRPPKRSRRRRPSRPRQPRRRQGAATI